jgi:hypothetical protein
MSFVHHISVSNGTYYVDQQRLPESAVTDLSEDSGEQPALVYVEQPDNPHDLSPVFMCDSSRDDCGGPAV